VDAVLCGHIHSAAIRQIGDVTYYNCGDWVEQSDGHIEMVNYHPFAVAARLPRRPVEPEAALA